MFLTLLFAIYDMFTFIKDWSINSISEDWSKTEVLETENASLIAQARLTLYSKIMPKIKPTIWRLLRTTWKGWHMKSLISEILVFVKPV